MDYDLKLVELTNEELQSEGYTNNTGKPIYMVIRNEDTLLGNIAYDSRSNEYMFACNDNMILSVWELDEIIGYMGQVSAPTEDEMS